MKNGIEKVGRVYWYKLGGFANPDFSVAGVGEYGSII